MITSRQNQRVKDAAKLRDRRARQASGRTLVDGRRELSRAVEAGVRPVEVFVCRELLPADEVDLLMARLDAAGAVVSEVTAAVFGKLAFGDRAEGVVGVIETPTRSLADLALPPRASVAVLEGVEKPGNVGAVLRSADAAGVAAVLVADGGTDLWNPAAIRASLSAIFALPVCQCTSSEAIAWLREQRLPIFAARPDAANSYTQADLSAGGAIVLGSEAHGLSDAWSADDVRPIALPMQGVVDSLNVSATAAVLFYEALRQRTNADCGMRNAE